MRVARKMRQSTGDNPPNEQQPEGHGKERRHRERAVTSVDDSVDTATLARRVDAYLVEYDDKFLLDPKFRPFSLRTTHFAKPPDVELILLREPRLWFNIVMVALFAALGLAST